MEPEVMWVMWNLISICLETVLVSVQDRSMVCAERTIGSENILDTPAGTPRDEAHVEAWFGTFGDSANLDARRCMFCVKCTTGSEIFLDAPNGTP
jgi:hypothetical protein